MTRNIRRIDIRGLRLIGDPAYAGGTAGVTGKRCSLYEREPGDVDCVRSRTTWIVANGRIYPPGEWIRIWTSKWFYAA
ncbi:hypothetical protein [Microtetraspora glauca]|uniref:Uncharacterized protein n=1 Tax=Microtetraspora glauca TaxID=1996 RepID=A0ABV3G8A5_MICGL